jgi:hypothetical protein
MRTFAQKQNQPQKPVSSSFARSNTAILGPNHHVNPLLHLQRTIGNRAVQRTLRTSGDELKAGLNGTASPLFRHDFSRIPIHSPPTAVQIKLATPKSGDECEQETGRVANQMFAVSAHTGVSGAPSRNQRLSGRLNRQMDSALASPGTPQGSAVRQDMEGSFGHDLRSGLQRRASRLTPTASPSMAVIQPKLKVGEPNNKFEHDADRVADKVMKMPTASPPVIAISTSASVQPSSAIQPDCVECARSGGGCPRCAEKEKIESNTRTETTNAIIQPKPGDVAESNNKTSLKEGDKKAELEFHSTIAFNSTNSGSSSTGPSEEGFAFLEMRWVVWNTGWETAPEHLDRLTIYKADRCSGCRDEKDEIFRTEVTAPSTAPITQPGGGEFKYEGITPTVGMTIQAGHYDVYVDLDVYDEVEEINEDNNTAFTTFYVKPRNKSEPDTEGEEETIQRKNAESTPRKREAKGTF